MTTLEDARDRLIETLDIDTRAWDAAFEWRLLERRVDTLKRLLQPVIEAGGSEESVIAFAEAQEKDEAYVAYTPFQRPLTQDSWVSNVVISRWEVPNARS
jgi:hypothetical protein